MEHTHKKPCRECPFRKESLPGYLGADNPEDFLATTLDDFPMPCHLTVDYEEDGWESLVGASYCAGALSFFRNMCKMSRDRKRPQGEKDETVFSRPDEFLKHHKSLEVRKSTR